MECADVKCNCCMSLVQGERFKCFDCIDYDLCSKCAFDPHVQCGDTHDPRNHVILKVCADQELKKTEKKRQDEILQNLLLLEGLQDYGIGVDKISKYLQLPITFVKSQMQRLCKDVEKDIQDCKKRDSAPPALINSDVTFPNDQQDEDKEVYIVSVWDSILDLTAIDLATTKDNEMSCGSVDMLLMNQWVQEGDQLKLHDFSCVMRSKMLSEKYNRHEAIQKRLQHIPLLLTSNKSRQVIQKKKKLQDAIKLRSRSKVDKCTQDLVDDVLSKEFSSLKSIRQQQSHRKKKKSSTTKQSPSKATTRLTAVRSTADAKPRATRSGKILEVQIISSSEDSDVEEETLEEEQQQQVHPDCHVIPFDLLMNEEEQQQCQDMECNEITMSNDETETINDSEPLPDCNVADNDTSNCLLMRNACLYSLVTRNALKRSCLAYNSNSQVSLPPSKKIRLADKNLNYSLSTDRSTSHVSVSTTAMTSSHQNECNQMLLKTVSWIQERVQGFNKTQAIVRFLCSDRVEVTIRQEKLVLTLSNEQLNCFSLWSKKLNSQGMCHSNSSDVKLLPENISYTSQQPYNQPSIHANNPRMKIAPCLPSRMTQQDKLRRARQLRHMDRAILQRCKHSTPQSEETKEATVRCDLDTDAFFSSKILPTDKVFQPIEPHHSTVIVPSIRVPSRKPSTNTPPSLNTSVKDVDNDLLCCTHTVRPTSPPKIESNQVTADTCGTMMNSAQPIPLVVNKPLKSILKKRTLSTVSLNSYASARSTLSSVMRNSNNPRKRVRFEGDSPEDLQVTLMTLESDDMKCQVIDSCSISSESTIEDNLDQFLLPIELQPMKGIHRTHSNEFDFFDSPSPILWTDSTSEDRPAVTPPTAMDITEVSVHGNDDATDSSSDSDDFPFFDEVDVAPTHNQTLMNWLFEDLFNLKECPPSPNQLQIKPMTPLTKGTKKRQRKHR